MQRFGLLLALVAVFTIAASASDMQVTIINRHHMVSLSSFAEKFGANIDYDNARDGINITLADRTVELIPYNQTAWISGRAITLDQPVVIVDDVTYLPLRFMCETFNLGYTCHDDDNQVVIVNNCTHESFFLVIDWGWSRCRHVWCYDYDCRGYRNWRNDHNVIIAIHRDGGHDFDHHNGNWDHHVDPAGGHAQYQSHQFSPNAKMTSPADSGRALNNTGARAASNSQRIPLYHRANNAPRFSWNRGTSTHTQSSSKKSGQSHSGDHQGHDKGRGDK